MSERRGVARNRSALNRVAENCRETEKSRRGAAGKHRRAWRYHATVAILAIVFIATAARAASIADVLEERRDSHKIAYSFVFMGCNRLLKGDKSSDNPSTAKLPSFRKAWASACERAGFRGRLVHDLRRSAVRNFVNSGMPDSVAMRITGHKTRAMFDRYNIRDDSDVQAGLAAMQKWVSAQAKLRAKVSALPQRKSA